MMWSILMFQLSRSAFAASYVIFLVSITQSHYTLRKTGSGGISSCKQDCTICSQCFAQIALAFTTVDISASYICRLTAILMRDAWLYGMVQGAEILVCVHCSLKLWIILQACMEQVYYNTLMKASSIWSKHWQQLVGIRIIAC